MRAFLLAVGAALAASCGKTSEDVRHHPDASLDDGNGATSDSGADAPLDTADAADASEAPTCWLPEPNQPVTEAQKACDALAAAACERMGVCIPGEWYFELALGLPHADVATCRSRLAILCADRLALPGSPPAADLVTCAAKVSGWSCADVFTATRFGEKPASSPITPEAALHLCGTHGARADGEPCDSSMQCASDNCRRQNPDFACGVCTPFQQAEANCEGGCDFGLYCGTKIECGDAGCVSTPGVCMPYGGAGAACVDPSSNPQWSLGCGPGLYCYQGTCMVSAGPGQACAAENDAPPYCDRFQGYECGPTGICTFVPPTPMSKLCFSPDNVYCYVANVEGEGCACLYPATHPFGTCVLPTVRCTK